MKDMTASKAVKWLFIAEILVILSIVPVLGLILMLVGSILNLVALYGASKLEEGYNKAFTAAIVSIVLSVVNFFVSGAFLSGVMTILSTVISYVIVFYVVTTTCALLELGGKSDVAAKGATVNKLYLICTVAAVVISLLSFIPLLGTALSFVLAIVRLVAYILYLIFLYKAYNAL